MQSRKQAARKHARPQDPETWEADMTALGAAAGGMLKVTAVMFGDLETLALEALLGSSDARDVLLAIQHSLAQTPTEAGDGMVLCVSCDNALDDHYFSLCVALPGVFGKRERGLVCGICSDCATTREGVLAKGIAAVQQIWPDAREVTLQPGGRA